MGPVARFAIHDGDVFKRAGHVPLPCEAGPPNPKLKWLSVAQSPGLAPYDLAASSARVPGKLRNPLDHEPLR